MTRHGNGPSWLAILVVLVVGALSAGCTTCAAPDYINYGAYGGVWQRSNMAEGRVGSAFEPAGFRIDEAEAADPQPTPAGPPPASQLIRVPANASQGPQNAADPASSGQGAVDDDPAPVFIQSP